MPMRPEARLPSLRLPARCGTSGACCANSPTWNRHYPERQILAVAELPDGRRIVMPSVKQLRSTFKTAPKDKGPQAATVKLPM